MGFPTRLHVRVPRFTCTNQQCRRKIFQASLNGADDGAKLTHRVTGWILQRLAIDRMSVATTAQTRDQLDGKDGDVGAGERPGRQQPRDRRPYPGLFASG